MNQDSQNTSHDDRYKKLLSFAISEGWTVSSEGPSGAQLKKPRKMATSTKVVLYLGIILLLAWGVGLILIIISLIDYYVRTKEQTYYLDRSRPMPAP